MSSRNSVRYAVPLALVGLASCLVGYDQSPNTDLYRGHIDDLEISNP